MTGLELARAFYEHCLPLLLERIPDVLEEAAIGLVGEGSECFGCDDAISRDHDFGPAFCLWVSAATLGAQRNRIGAAFDALPESFMGLPSRLAPEHRCGPAAGRVGPLAVEDFYAFFTGLRRPPETWQEWLAIPEYQLAACTNGAVFVDNSGTFGRWRQTLLAGYPQDVRLKKLSCRCMHMAQCGQYNLPRALERGDAVAAMLAQARFAEAALSFVYLANNRYMPFYKWAGKLAAGLPVLGAEVCTMLAGLAATPLGDASRATQAVQAAERFCTAAAAWLRDAGLSRAEGNWLWAHGPEIMRHVGEPTLRAMDMLREDVPPAPRAASQPAGAGAVTTIRDLHDQAYAALEQNRLDASIALFAQALDLAAERYGADSLAVADAAQRLAVPHYRKREYDTAERYLNKARAIWEAQPRKSSPLGVCYNNLGRIYEERGQSAEGIALHRKALALRQELLGEHEDTAFSHGNLGVALAQDGQWHEAATQLEAAVAMYGRLGQGTGELARSYAANLDVCRRALA